MSIARSKDCVKPICPNERAGRISVRAITGGLIRPEHGYTYEEGPKASIDHLAVGLVAARIDTGDDSLASGIGSQRLARIEQPSEGLIGKRPGPDRCEFHKRCACPGLAAAPI
jgi:hypothetical protein